MHCWPPRITCELTLSLARKGPGMATLKITQEVVNLLKAHPNKPYKIAEIAAQIPGNTPLKNVGSTLQQLVNKPGRSPGIVRTGYGMYAYRPKPVITSVPSSPVDPPAKRPFIGSDSEGPPIIHSMDAVSAYPAELTEPPRNPFVELFGMTMDGTRLIRDEYGDLYYLGEKVK